MFDTSRCFRTWVFSIANNMCKNEYRRMEVRKGTTNEFNDEYIIGLTGNEFDRDLDRAAFMEKLKEAVEELKEGHKTVFQLRYFEEMSIKEIAEIVDCSEGTVKSRLFYSIKKLAEKLEVFDPKKTEISYEEVKEAGF